MTQNLIFARKHNVFVIVELLALGNDLLSKHVILRMIK
jgi:hypothetical protein